MNNMHLVGITNGAHSIYAGFHTKNLKNFKEKYQYITNISLNYHIYTRCSYKDLF